MDWSCDRVIRELELELGLGLEMKKKWALFFSGRGSNLEAVLKVYSKQWTSAPYLVTNNSRAGGLNVAQTYNLEVHLMNRPYDYKALSKCLKKEQVERIFLLGYMSIVPSEFIEDWEGGFYNLHPSLLPSFHGLKSIERAYNEKAAIGVTIHRVIPQVDAGEILVQSEVFSAGTYDHLSLEEVTSMVHSKEHQMVCDFIPKGESEFGSDLRCSYI